MGRPGHDLRRWNSLGAPLVPVAEDDRELKISPASSPMRGPGVGSGPDACASLTCDEGSLSDFVEQSSSATMLSPPRIKSTPLEATHGLLSHGWRQQEWPDTPTGAAFTGDHSRAQGSSWLQGAPWLEQFHGFTTGQLSKLQEKWHHG